METSDNSRAGHFFKNKDVKEMLSDLSKNINEPLYNFIYFEKKLNINKVADLTNHSRQYLWGVLHRRMKASFSFARAVCDVLSIKELRTLFRPDDLEEPGFLTADKLEKGDSKGNGKHDED